MAVMLPAELSKFLNMVGFEWPEGNEDKVFDWGGAWQSYANDVQAIGQRAAAIHGQLTGANKGPAIEAFSSSFNRDGNVADIVGNLSTAGSVTGGCLYLIGAAIIALKVAFVVNLVAFAIEFAAAVAAAIPTAGASLSLIPIAELVAQRAIQYAINLAVEKLLGG